MKNLFATVIAAAVVSAVCNIGLDLARERNVADLSPYEVDKLTAGIGTNSASIASLRSDLRELRDRSARDQGPATGDLRVSPELAINELVDRMDALEESVQKLSADGSAGSLSVKDGSDGLARFLAANSQSSAETAAVFESDFESDSGKPLGDFSDSIDEALHSIEGFQVKGVECRNTICRVAYSRPESSGSQGAVDPENELVDRLALSAPGREVEVRYDKDTFGGDIMYIRLR